MSDINVLDEKASDLSEIDLNSHYADAYGIISGKPREVAILKFSPERAKWISGESWHPEQISSFLDDGSYELRFPFNSMDELVLDICRYGPDVEVMGPNMLRDSVASLLLKASRQYE